MDWKPPQGKFGEFTHEDGNQIKTDGTACQRSGLEFWHVVFLFAIRNCYIRKESHGFTNTIARVENLNTG